MNGFEIFILILFSFLPPIIYATWIRNTEKYRRERWISIFFCFLWGSTIAVTAAIFIELILGYFVISIGKSGILAIIAAVIIAPFAEELTKPLALRFKIVRKELDEIEDGFIYGAVAGLGFSATENLFYGYTFLTEGLLFFIILITIRSFGGCLLHASATAWTGFGYGKKIMTQTPLLKVLPYFLLAIAVHAFYNALLVFDFIGLGFGLIGALIFAFITIYFVRKKIIYFDGISK
jgi:RsiW-degrading membrane proteinase PrsW (M82 family)